MKPSPADPHQKVAALQHFVWAAVGLLLFVFFLPWFPSVLTTDLDSSWMGAIDFLNRNDSAIGGRVFFTYGPYGHAFRTAYYGQSLGLWFIFHLIKAALTTVVAIHLARGRGIFHAIATLFAALLAAMFSDEALLLLLVAAGAFQLTQKSHLWSRLGIAALFSFLALVKFTLTVNIAAALVVVVVALVFTARVWSAIQVVSAFLGTFLALWLAAGNSLGQIPIWLITSVHIASGYPAAMGLNEPIGIFLTALAGVTVVLAVVAANWLMPRPTTAIWPGCALVCLATFFVWKHGITRAPGHTVILFGILPLLTAAALATWPTTTPPRWRWLSVIAMVAALGIAVVGGLRSISPELVAQIPWRLKQHALNGKTWDSGLTGPSQAANTTLATLKAKYQMPWTANVVRKKTVDVFGFEQGVALLNDYNYWPRPVLQSYSAYTPNLIAMNGAFFRGKDAPAMVLFKLQGIDGHIASLADGDALLEILSRYRPHFVENGFLLMERMPERLSVATTVQAHAAAIGTKPMLLGEWIELPAPPSDCWQRVKIDLPPTLLGKIRTLLYKPALATIELRFSDNHIEQRRINLTSAPAGFLTAPWLDHTSEVTGLWLRPAERRRVTALRVIPASDTFLPCLPTAGHIEISCQSFEIAALTTDELNLLRGANSPLMASILGIPPYSSRLADGRTFTIKQQLVAMVTPNDWLVFKAPDDAVGISGRWGVLEGAYTPPNASDGMALMIEAGPEATGPWSRLQEWNLDPAAKLEHRGFHPFQFRVSENPQRWIRIRFGPGPRKNPDYDWGGLYGLSWLRAAGK